MTITEFLLARITEDEAAAKYVPPRFVSVFMTAEQAHSLAAFKAATSQERMLAECAAKRAIIEQHSEFLYTDDEPGFSMVMWDCMCPRQTGKPCPTVGALAAVYSEHPDYRPEWAPTPTS